MAPRSTTPPPAPIAAVTPAPQTQQQGYAVQILGFIPIPKGDLRKQIEIPQLLLDISEGRKTLSDLVPHLKAVEFRQHFTGRRFTVDEVRAWDAPPKQEEEQQDDDETEQDDGE